MYVCLRDRERQGEKKRKSKEGDAKEKRRELIVDLNYFSCQTTASYFFSIHLIARKTTTSRNLFL